MDNMATRLKRERTKRGWTQGKLAQRAGVGETTIFDLESDPTRATTKLLQIARALSVNPVWLETGKGPKEPVVDPVTAYVIAESIDDLAEKMLAKGDGAIVSLLQRILELKSTK
jgi:transcriptional regulator with XRE-family HTH domain